VKTLVQEVLTEVGTFLPFCIYSEDSKKWQRHANFLLATSCINVSRSLIIISCQM